jgi:hypothetical protein
MPTESGYPTKAVLDAGQECLLKLARVHERLEHLESVVRRCEKERLPLFREPLHRSYFKFHVSVRNLRLALRSLTDAMMPIHKPRNATELRRIIEEEI